MSNEKKDKGIAIAGTIVVHALVLLVLFLMAFRTPLPLPGEEGVEVDLGMMDQGMGNIQPEKPAIPMAAQPQQQQNKSKEDIVTQNDNEAPAIEKPKNTKPKQETKPVEEPKPTVNQKALFKGSNNPQAGGSEGITGQPGDQGKPNGLAGIKKYDGNGGKGNGTGYDLGGRGAKSLHRPDDDFSEEGRIVVDIWVNRDGQVVRAEVATKGTDIINNAMRQKAIQAAKRSTFASDPDAPEEQHGTITYTFVINQ
ncbi:MAG: energy transducer TonB [Bacteroidales bacterium]|nr:energy transducer TonB [Bacteroidales bacterium]